MDKELILYSGILMLSVVISSVSQLLLKISARRAYPSKIREYLNPYVISGYGMFFACTLLSMIAMRVVPLSTEPILGSTGYVFVSVFSFLFLKERLTVKQIVGIMLIVIGVVVYSL